ncbi:MAG: phosphate butyryltransferase [Candidatus Riflebacteria bacterium]|nr:phosphate butyryltransferase [Candidatus Riflebacteria bacterium]
MIETENFFDTLLERSKWKSVVRLAVPVAQDEACASAIIKAVKAEIIEAILIGNPVELKNFYSEILDCSGVKIISSMEPEEACKKAVELVRNDEADLLMKGLVSTSTILKAVLNSQTGIKRNPLLSHLAFFELRNYPGLKLLTDAAINIAPDADALGKIAANAVEAYKNLTGKTPKVALLSANEKVSEKVSSTVLAKTVSEKMSSFEGAVISGPVSLDLAISPESVKIKKFTGSIQGDADILVAPRIETGNVLYKSLQYFARAKMGGVVFGAKCPVVLTSRSDSNETKLNSLLLGISLLRSKTGPSK